MDYERPFWFKVKKYFLLLTLLLDIVALIYYFAGAIKFALDSPDYFYNREEKNKVI